MIHSERKCTKLSAHHLDSWIPELVEAYRKDDIGSPKLHLLLNLHIRKDWSNLFYNSRKHWTITKKLRKNMKSSVKKQIK